MITLQSDDCYHISGAADDAVLSGHTSLPLARLCIRHAPKHQYCAQKIDHKDENTLLKEGTTMNF